MSREDVFAAIDVERCHQAEQWNQPHSWGWGDCSSPHIADIVKLGVLAEEVGEVSRAVLEHDREQVFGELVQVAAVAVAWLEGLLQE